MRYDARPRSLFNFAFDLVADEKTVGLAQHKLFGRKGLVRVGDWEYEIARVGPIAWELRQAGVPGAVAASRRPGVMRTRLQVDWDGQSLELARSGLGYRFKLFRDDEQVGEINLANLFSRRLVMDLPDDVPHPVVGFIVWLVVRMRRSAAMAASAGA
jgi:hypothetical protein